MPDRNRASFRKVFARFQDTSLRGSTSAHRPRWRVALSLELVILTVAVFFAFTANGAFWASVKESGVLSGAREAVVAHRHRRDFIMDGGQPGGTFHPFLIHGLIEETDVVGDTATE